jgi:hypothetical protein
MTDRQEPGRAPMREERKERCPRCLLRGGYKYYPGSQAGFEPAESACHICGLNWQEGKGCMLERQAVDFYHATYSDDWADTWRGVLQDVVARPVAVDSDVGV